MNFNESNQKNYEFMMRYNSEEEFKNNIQNLDLNKEKTIMSCNCLSLTDY